MCKKVNSIFIGLVFMALTICSVVKGADAFCVYNETDTAIRVVQSFGSKPLHEFVVVIEPDDDKCCNWKNEDCNTGGDRDSMVAFDVDSMSAEGWVTGHICKWFRIKAGGWLTVKGKKGKYKCVAHFE